MMQAQEQYIEFSIGEFTYAIKIAEVHEIIRMQPITDIPHSRPDVRGVFSLRGKVVPVIGLRTLFQLPREVETKSTRIVVVGYREQSVGLIVDRVNKVTSYAEIHPAPEQAGSESSKFLHGIGLRDKQLVGILKLDEVLLSE